MKCLWCCVECLWVLTYIHTNTHTHTHTHICIYIYNTIHTYIHTHAYIHTYVHTYIHDSWLFSTTCTHWLNSRIVKTYMYLVVIYNFHNIQDFFLIEIHTIYAFCIVDNNVCFVRVDVKESGGSKKCSCWEMRILPWCLTVIYCYVVNKLK